LELVDHHAKEQSKLSKEEWREYTKTVWQIANTTDPDHPAVFPVEIPRRLIKLFSFVGETILDPFAGVGSTALAALELDRRSISIDQNADFIKLVEARLGEAFPDREADWSAQATDCRQLTFLEDASVELIVTSPPYWNKADYGDSAANLGIIDSYPEFLRQLRPALEECFRVLKPGRKIGLVTANVNQHTDHGLLTFPLATDIAVILRDIGFVMINEIIWSKDKTGGRWGSANGQRPIFGSYPYPPNFLFKNVHEYVLIFARPGTPRSRGKTALPYSQLMELSEWDTPSDAITYVTERNGHRPKP
jgi:site-specific DNA-methyltransferase (adenine-specific)